MIFAPKMAMKRALFSTTTIAVLLLLTLTKTTAFPEHSHKNNTTRHNNDRFKKLIAHDAIRLTIDEGYEIRRFIASLPSLESLRATLGQDADKAEALIYDCQLRLDTQLNGISHTLHRLQHESYRRTPHVFFADTQALKETVDGVVMLGCSKECGSDDKFVSALLQRRLQGFSQTIDDVVHLVSPIVPPKSTLAGTHT